MYYYSILRILGALINSRVNLGLISILLIACLSISDIEANPNGCCGDDTDIKPYFLSGAIEARISQPSNRGQDAYINYRKRGTLGGSDLLV